MQWVPQRSRQDDFVGGHPLESGLYRQGNDGLRDGPFRGPETARPSAKQVFVVLHGPDELFFRIIRVMKATRRKFGLGIVSQVNVCVAQKR